MVEAAAGERDTTPSSRSW